MTHHEYEWRYLQAASSELKDYLLSDEIYWHTGVTAKRGRPPYPRFSLGWLLLFWRRAGAGGVPAGFLDTDAEIARIRDRWRSAWERKAARDFGMRLKLWTRFINEVRQDRNAHAGRYAYEVQRRAMLDLLAEEAGELPGEQGELLRGLDAALRGLLKQGSFIGAAEDEAAFPRARFWYFYGEIQEGRAGPGD